jgi:hypothetical protein
MKIRPNHDDMEAAQQFADAMVKLARALGDPDASATIEAGPADPPAHDGHTNTADPEGPDWEINPHEGNRWPA